MTLMVGKERVQTEQKVPGPAEIKQILYIQYVPAPSPAEGSLGLAHNEPRPCQPTNAATSQKFSFLVISVLDSLTQTLVRSCFTFLLVCLL